MHFTNLKNKIFILAFLGILVSPWILGGGLRIFSPEIFKALTSVETEKERIIGFYECQEGATTIAPNKRLSADFRGRNMHRRAAFAEAYAIYPGTSQGSRCIFTELQQPST